jgi:hypothetical protein
MTLSILSDILSSFPFKTKRASSVPSYKVILVSVLKSSWLIVREFEGFVGIIRVSSFLPQYLVRAILIGLTALTK